MTVGITIDAFCIKIDELCIENDELCIQNDDLNTNGKEIRWSILMTGRFISRGWIALGAVRVSFRRGG